ncbi:MAG: hypothetical protein AAGC60_27610 [Acidobacteriota bacterium]
MSARRRHRFVIDRTWDGRSVPRDDAARVDLVAVTGGLELRIDSPFHDDPPPPGPPGSTPGLWRFEVVELFLAGALDEAGRRRYTEIEIGPRGHYLVLRFAGPRRSVAEGLELEVETAIDDGRWRARVPLPAGHLPPPPHRAAAFAIHGPPEARRHRAAHPIPGSQPDFHQPELFRPIDLELPADASTPS